jgi:hypothetical protein
VVFDTALGGLTVSDQFLQVAAKLPSANVYGFAEQVSWQQAYAARFIYRLISVILKLEMKKRQLFVKIHQTPCWFRTVQKG